MPFSSPRDAASAEAGKSETRQARPKPLFGLASTVLIATLLVVPFGIHYVLDTEPYPAIIFPGGASTAFVEDGQTTFVTPVLYGADKDGQMVEVDIPQLLSPVPTSHLSGLIATDFGQDETSIVSVDSGRLGWEFEYNRHVPTGAEREAVRKWLGEKLTGAGLVSDTLILRYERVVVANDTGEVVSRETVDEETVL